MLRSMYSGISGMRVNQTKLDVVGNNIANVGTTGFKASRAKFSDMLSQNVSNAMAPSQNQGGVNASQVGLGVQLASIDAIMTQGNLQSTGRPLDVAIDKSGFFIVSSGPVVNSDTQLQVNHASGTHSISKNSANDSNTLSYSRDGSFILDSNGNLLTGDGYRVMGYSLTNDDSSKPPTAKQSNTVSAAGLDFRFGPGSQLNEYKVVLGSVGPNTVASAAVDKVAKTIVVNGDFSTPGALDLEQIQLALNKGLSASGISQSMFVTGTPTNIANLGSDSIKGGEDATVPNTITVGGFTVQFNDGSKLNGYKFQVGKVNDTALSVTADTGTKIVTINGDFINNGSITGTALKDAINNALSDAGIDQTVRNVTGSAQNLTGISAKTTATVVGVVPTTVPASGAIAGFTFSADPASFGDGLNGYTISFGNLTATSLGVAVNKSAKTITINGNSSVLDPDQIAAKINSTLGSDAPKVVVAGAYDAAASATPISFTGGVDYVKPKDITFANGFTMSFKATADGTASPLDEYEVVIGNVDKDATSASVDTTNKKITINGNFLSPGKVTAADLTAKINAELAAASVITDPAVDGIKVTGSEKIYTGLASDLVEGGGELLAPGSVTGLGLTFAASEGASLNGYKIQMGVASSGTKTSADVDVKNKLITINGDFVSGTLSPSVIEAAINKSLQTQGINQGITVSGTPLTLSGTESEQTIGGTPVQSMDEDGSINFVDGTGDLKAYDGALKSLKIPDKVKLPGSNEELRIKSYTIDQSGIINGVLEDGRVAALGQIAMANFKNPEGLTKLGGNLYSTSVNSGDALVRSGVGTLGEDNSLGYGSMVQGMLEMSNVDLAEQFTEMIVATRAFQASSKAINTGDEILQDIIGLKR